MCNSFLSSALLFLLNYIEDSLYKKKGLQCFNLKKKKKKKPCILTAWISQSGPTLGQCLDQIIDLFSIEEITSQHSRLQEFQITRALVLN